jgi:hypothetical protein
LTYKGNRLDYFCEESDGDSALGSVLSYAVKVRGRDIVGHPGCLCPSCSEAVQREVLLPLDPIRAALVGKRYAHLICHAKRPLYGHANQIKAGSLFHGMNLVRLCVLA